VDEERKWSGVECLSRGEMGRCCLLCTNMRFSFVKVGVLVPFNGSFLGDNDLRCARVTTV
jgi:hypothetical protein